MIAFKDRTMRLHLLGLKHGLGVEYLTVLSVQSKQVMLQLCIVMEMFLVIKYRMERSAIDI